MKQVSSNRRRSSATSPWTTALLAVTVIAAGLASRRYPLLGNYPGDALWATLVFLIWTFALPRTAKKKILVLTLLTAFSVEISQLFHPPWLESIRANPIGRLVLGNGFDPIDLLAYSVGSFLGMLLIRIASKATRSSDPA